jgi:hypothetical protein
MNNKIQQLLCGKGDNYILPFLWQSGESKEIIREEMARIHESGIGAVCVESRPHPDFVGPLWWRDLDIIMDEARRLEMRVWVLDDAHFPTGYANGWIRDRYPEKGKRYLVERHIDSRGPLSGATFLVCNFLNLPNLLNPGTLQSKDDCLLAVVAARRTGQDEEVDDTLLDLTKCVRDGVLRWDVPEGFWRVFILYTTRSGGGNPDYLNPLDADSVRVLIDAVYEPHFAQYGSEFGKTFAGFFSDEPGMGNTSGYAFDESIGRKRMPLPWSAELPQHLKEALGDDYPMALPGLWYSTGVKSAIVRHRYMDIVTSLYARNFTGQLGNWCRSHGVEYIGHVIEDQNVHARLGAGAGHFFRALGGQDMAGVDVVIQQILPGFDSIGPNYFGGSWDGEFFHYGLGKMASSLGHIDPLKRGRSVCEIFGAYGWMEGLKLMKWLTDHMVVRGVNWFVPHAFSPRPFPDHDCPPHFYAHGHNPQYRYFHILMNYMNRLCHLLNSGTHVATAAVLYHAEAEWCGDYMPFHQPARTLMQNQIDFDVLPAEALDSGSQYQTQFQDGCLIVNGETYRCLVVPYTQILTYALAESLCNAAESGLRVVFVDAPPERVCDTEESDVRRLLSRLMVCDVLPLDKLAVTLQEDGYFDISADAPCSYLRHYHYHQEGFELYLFFNEHHHDTARCGIRLQTSGCMLRYDPFDNHLFTYESQPDGDGVLVDITLSPYESLVLVQGNIDGLPVSPSRPLYTDSSAIVVDGPWQLSLSAAVEYPAFREAVRLDKLCDLSQTEWYPHFSGTMRYELDFRMDISVSEAWIDLGNAYETTEVWLNDRLAGVRICPPYRFDVSDLLLPGVNRLRVDVTNTLVREQRDLLSTFSALEPSGLLGPVQLHISNTNQVE